MFSKQKGSEMVGDVGNVRNASEEVRSKVWDMTIMVGLTNPKV